LFATNKSQESIFQAENLSLVFGSGEDPHVILQNINLDVKTHEFLTIVGGSGVGKTSLLRMLGGLTPASSGTLTFRGHSVNAPPHGVVVVFQDYVHALLQWRTVLGNVTLSLESKLSGHELRDRAMQALQMVGLENSANKFPWQLSGGMQQRVQIARALAQQPSVLLMDEPFGALDAMTKAVLQDELLRIHSTTDTTFVFITHDIEEAVYLGDRVAILDGPPGHIKHIVQVPIARPRNQIQTRQEQAFLRIRHELHDAIFSNTNTQP